MLVGLPFGPALAEAAMTAGLDELSPIDDVRGSADYRRTAAREIVARTLLAAGSGRHGLDDWRVVSALEGPRHEHAIDKLRCERQTGCC